ncbi:MAG: DUF5946 family protein [Acidimicrobiia bacterium]|nr:DUF5946 family protein [Acidimicrobiia bacterium]
MARCPGCLGEFDDFDGPVHRYIGASAACWHLYGRVLAGELPGRNPLGVDAYAAQHPGIESPQSKQSVAIHLITLEAVLRRDIPVEEAVSVRNQAVDAGRRQRNGYRWLDPAPTGWPFTLADVVAGIEPDTWAVGVLESWKALHPLLIARWTDEVLSDHGT